MNYSSFPCYFISFFYPCLGNNFYPPLNLKKLKNKLLASFCLLLFAIISPSIFYHHSPNKFPVSEIVLERKAYSVCYDAQHRQPRWICESLTKKSIQGNANRENVEFKVDSLLPQIFQSSNLDYKNSGFDRGHLCPAADARFSQEAMEETFYLSNISPQKPAFNRGYWLKLENHVRNLAKRYKKIKVYSGPLFLPKEEANGKRYVKYQVIGKSDVAVPTHFFKVVFIGKGRNFTEAFIIPNEAIALDKPLEDFRTTIEKIEQAAGLIFPKK